MEDPPPPQQYLGTNYIPTSQEIDTIKALIEERKGAIDSIDADEEEEDARVVIEGEVPRGEA
jgi:hypothetical protein